ncbi:MAG TPA: hypothetical protein VH063_01185 [Gaiellaceae bacterium]|jgi:hypothetical protein|nr:hypothetical protein [Gaiellaceae bacterium]
MKEETSAVDGQNVRHLAERWGLPYREAHTLSIDPAALEIVDRDESRRLRVLPLEVGADGPVFAVAEPSEERFAEVREIAGDNATFVLVALETLDALLNSKVFSVPNSIRRPTLFRARTDGAEPASDEAEPIAEGGEPAPEDQPAHEPHEEPGENQPAHEHGEPSVNHGTMHEQSTESTEALENLFSQIASGAGSLRAQVTELTASLEAAQHELRQANEQLAEAHRVAESHNEAVVGLKAEIQTLQEQLAGSTAMNHSMTARLEEVARALMDPSSGNGEG